MHNKKTKNKNNKAKQKNVVGTPLQAWVTIRQQIIGSEIIQRRTPNLHTTNKKYDRVAFRLPPNGNSKEN